MIACNQIVGCHVQNGRHVDTECGKPATHYLFGHKDAPICDEHIEECRRSGDWTEAELALSPIPVEPKI